MKIPQRTIDGLTRYVENRIHPGDFLRAVLENNLSMAFGRADDENRECMYEIVAYIYTKLPAQSWGSEEKVYRWLIGEEQVDL